MSIIPRSKETLLTVLLLLSLISGATAAQVETQSSSEVTTNSFLAEGVVTSDSGIDVNASIQYRKTVQTQLEPVIVFSSSDSEDYGKIQVTGITQTVIS